MYYHSKIHIYQNPIVWIKDKYKTGLNKKEIYFIALLPTIPVILGIISNLSNLYEIGHDELTLLILWALIVYGLLNLLLLFLIQKTGIRLERERSVFKILHKNVIESFREYFTEKEKIIKEGHLLTKIDIERHLKIIFESFNKTFMSDYYGGEICITLKYRKDGLLHCFRVGDYIINRHVDPEPIDNSFVYLTLSETGRKLRYIYVKNLDDTDKYENLVLGKYLEDVKSRAHGKYNTFIALPIRAGKLETHSSEFTTRPDLGMLGFDSMMKYNFGNFELHELDIIACLVDLLSEPVKDLINVQ